MHVFEIPNGKRPLAVVAGLIWHPLVPDNFKKDLIPLSIDTGTDLFVYRKSSKSMVGLVSSEHGAKAGQVALGMLVSDYLSKELEPQSALIAIQLPGEQNKFSYIMISDGFILADGDMVGSEDEIKDRFIQDLSAGGWDLLLCPREWAIKKSLYIDFDEFIPKKGKKVKVSDSWKLKPTKAPVIKNLAQLLLIGAMIAAPYYGYNYWSKINSQKQAALLAEQQAVAAEAERQAKLSAEPWPTIPTASAFAHACVNALDRVGLIAASWGVNEFTCEGDKFTMKWERSNGDAWVSHMKTLHPSAVISADGAFASVSTQMQLAKVEPTKGEAIPKLEPRKDKLRDLPNAFGMAVTFPAAAAAAVTDPAAVANQVLMPWSDFTVEVKTDLSPVAALGAIDGPGFRITKISGNFKDGILKYTITGTQYAKP